MLISFAVLAPLEVFYIHTYGHPSDSHLMGFLSETHYEEASDFLGAAGGWLLGAVLATLIVGVLLVRVLRKDAHQWRGRRRLWVSVAGLFAGGLLGVQDAPLASAEAVPDVAADEWNEMIAADGPSSGTARDLFGCF